MTITNKAAFLLISFYTSLCAAQIPTKIMIYQAYTNDNILNPNLVVAQRYTGECFSRSVANPGRSDAWQCRASNMTLDPCFEDGQSLACLISPWSHKAAILELNTPLYKGKIRTVDKNKYPWALQLVNGQHCIFLTGASTVYGNKRVNYACESYNYNVIGEIDRSKPTWQIDVYRFDTKSITRMAIKAAWF